METIKVEAVPVVTFRGTDARIGINNKGDLSGVYSVQTPKDTESFFSWAAMLLKIAAGKGYSSLVAGFSGPVSSDGRMIGPIPDIPGLAGGQYNLEEELKAVDPALGRLLDKEGFAFLTVSDRTLAAHAAADRFSGSYNKVAALVLGTGVGAGIVERDPRYTNVHRANVDPAEIGHLLLGSGITDTPENTISGHALKRRYSVAAHELPADHPAWKEVGEGVARLGSLLGLMSGVELVVPTGGVGIGASEKYGRHMRDTLEVIKNLGNGPQRDLLPAIMTVPGEEAQIFEMYGGAGVLRAHTTQEK